MSWIISGNLGSLCSSAQREQRNIPQTPCARETRAFSSEEAHLGEINPNRCCLKPRLAKILLKDGLKTTGWLFKTFSNSVTNLTPWYHCSHPGQAEWWRLVPAVLSMTLWSTLHSSNDLANVLLHTHFKPTMVFVSSFSMATEMWTLYFKLFWKDQVWTRGQWPSV